MASEVEICNSALIKLGDDTITSLTDDSKRARLCNAQFARLRDEVLRAHPWNFAIRRASLAKLSQAPAFEFAAAFRLPEDPYCLRVLLLFDGSAPQGISRHRWKIEGRTLPTRTAQRSSTSPELSIQISSTRCLPRRWRSD